MSGLDARYELAETIGKGGMGEVWACRDWRLGRDIALKRMHGQPGGDLAARFVNEARVQGQLEHPGVVPVYDAGVTPDGLPFFTMKRVRGKTLRQVFRALAEGDPSTVAEQPLHKLLAVFASLCLTIDFAHARGVIHRDLKPENIMLGDFGEVYVLDWGIAKGSGDPDVATPPMQSRAFATSAGAVVGTPGYGSPEQMRGELDLVDARTDVYALGAILFEMLTGKRLHPGDDLQRIESALRGADARASLRAPDREVPPELEAICVRATAQRREDRFATVRSLHDAVDVYLAGDRDLELRRKRGEEHLANASAAARDVFATGSLQRRREALREVGRALAFDPEHAEGRRLLIDLLARAPDEPPPEAQESIDQAKERVIGVAARTGARANLAVPLAGLPLILWMGVRSWPTVCVGTVLVLAMIVLPALNSRSARPTRGLAAVYLATAALVVTASALFGPFMVVPAMAVELTFSYTLHFGRDRRWFTIVVGALTVLVPAVLTLTGLWPVRFGFDDGHMTMYPGAVDLPRLATLATLLVASVGIVIHSGVFASRLAEAMEDAERKLHVQAWQLRQLAGAEGPPGSVRGVAAARPS